MIASRAINLLAEVEGEGLNWTDAVVVKNVYLAKLLSGLLGKHGVLDIIHDGIGPRGLYISKAEDEGYHQGPIP